MKNKNKTIMSIILNTIIFIIELLVLIKIAINKESLGIEYYTVESNLIALVSSALYVICSIVLLVGKIKNIPKFVKVLRYIETTSLFLTFFVVITILGQTTNLGYKTLLFTGNMLYQHTICPIISIISFIFFENYDFKGIKDITLAVLFTYLYAVVAIALNLLKIIEGPYPFLLVYKQPFYMSIIWLVVIMIIVNILAYILIKANRKFNKS